MLQGLGVAIDGWGVYEQRLREMESISVPQLLVSIGMPDLDSLANAKGNLRNRAQALNAYAANSSLQQQYSAIQNSYNDLGNAAMPQQPAQPPAPSLVPSSRAVWIDGKLLVIKRAETQTGAQIQGCWLDWERLQTWMSEQLADTLPGVEFEPISTFSKASPSPQQLASLPIRLKWDFPIEDKLREPAISDPSDEQWYRVLVLPLTVAWFSWFLGAVGAAGLLMGVWRLSQRRATFVSAVTHELRTPLTTFRLYTDLLLSRKDLQESQRESYLRTLNSQSDRLARLVENVLTFAKLDGKARKLPMQSISIDRLLSFIQPRLNELAQRYQATIEVDANDQVRNCGLKIHEEMFEQMLTNLVENACKYGLAADRRTVRLECRVEGPG